jgi:hypothetical protein
MSAGCTINFGMPAAEKPGFLQCLINKVTEVHYKPCLKPVITLQIFKPDK